MKTFFLTVLLAFAATQFAFAAKGVVVLKQNSCDYFLVSTNKGYALLEWYGGIDPDVGDTIAGEFESYGMKDVVNLTSNRQMRVWVDDFWLSKRRALEKYYEKCN